MAQLDRNTHLSRRQLYTCAGELQTFDIEGETVSEFYNVYYYGEELSFLRKDESSGHFILPNGFYLATRIDGTKERYDYLGRKIN